MIQNVRQWGGGGRGGVQYEVVFSIPIIGVFAFYMELYGLMKFVSGYVTIYVTMLKHRHYCSRNKLTENFGTARLFKL